MDYVNNHTKVCIICPEHGEFWQMPNSHINSKCGCPICKESKLEKEINNLLLENNINFERQKRFDWLGLQSLDFYLPDYNIAIECQGIQHFKPISFFGGEEHFNYVKKLDRVKKDLCDINQIKLIYINYNKPIIEEFNKLLKELK